MKTVTLLELGRRLMIIRFGESSARYAFESSVLNYVFNPNFTEDLIILCF